MARLERVFGLSINEEIQWGSALADLEQGIILDDYESGVLCEIPDGNLPNDAQDKVYLEREIRDGLLALGRTKRALLNEVSRVGISSIGVIDRHKNLLVSIARKNWVTELDPHTGRRPFLVNFNSLFLNGSPSANLFKRISRASQIIAQNDAPARCLAEYFYGFGDGPPNSLMYLMAGEGVNGAIVLAGDFPAMIGHPEFGHCTPHLHEKDTKFNPKHSGCPKHIHCFEGLASNARFRMQWGHDLWELHPDHKAWDVAAFYLAQMAMTGTLLLNPERIIFGGTLFYGAKGLDLISRIQKEFTRLNAGYLPGYEKLRNAQELMGRAAFGNGVWVMSALTIASSTLHDRLTVATVQKSANVFRFPSGESMEFES